MELIFKESAIKDKDYFKKLGDKSIMKKISVLLSELEEHPQIGTGKPEQLKSNLSGYWSRRINREHRLVYTIDEEKGYVTVHSMRGHY